MNALPNFDDLKDCIEYGQRLIVQNFDEDRLWLCKAIYFSTRIKTKHFKDENASREGELVEQLLDICTSIMTVVSLINKDNALFK